MGAHGQRCEREAVGLNGHGPEWRGKCATHAHMHAHTRMYAHTHTCTHTHACMHIHAHAHKHTYTYTHAHMHTCTHAHAHTHTHTHMHTRTRTHIHIHIHTEPSRVTQGARDSTHPAYRPRLPCNTDPGRPPHLTDSHTRPPTTDDHMPDSPLPHIRDTTQHSLA